MKNRVNHDFQEAIKILKKIDIAGVYLYSEFEDYKAAVDALEELVNTNIPKKPREYEDKFYGCPTCGFVLLHKWKKYNTVLTDKSEGLPLCLCCGQKLDWSDEQ